MKHFKDIRLSRDRHPLAVTSGIWLLVALIVPSVALCFTEHYNVLVSVGCVSVPLAVYCLIMSLCKTPWKTWLWMLPFTFFAAFQVVLLNLYGSGVIAVDMFLNVATTNTTEVYELLSGLLPGMIEIMVLYITPLVLAILAIKRGGHFPQKMRVRLRKCGWFMAVVGVVAFIVAWLVGMSVRPVRQIFPANAIDNLITSIKRWNQTENYPETSADFTFDAKSIHPADSVETYVLVVGESSRALDWQLSGYDRPTNPKLSGKDGLTYFPKTLSESNTTHKSVPILLSHIGSAEFNDSINKVKSIVAAFKEAGFRTSYFTMQRPNHSYIDFFAAEADSHIFVEPAKGEVKNDLDLLPLLDKELARPEKKKLIVLHCYGSHYNYRDRYPASMSHFTPDNNLESAKECRPRLINAYDNTILLTDSLLSAVINRLDKTQGISAMAYTSDHGENIYDDSRNLFLHASPKTSYYQQHVPFLVWLSRSYSGFNPSAAKAVRKHASERVSSSASMFHTVADLGGVSTPYLKKSLSVADSSYAAPPAVFINDYNEAVPIDQVLTDPLDQKMMRHFGF